MSGLGLSARSRPAASVDSLYHLRARDIEARKPLYRIEIHTGGVLGDLITCLFKWSRDNGTVVTSSTRSVVEITVRPWPMTSWDLPAGSGSKSSITQQNSMVTRSVVADRSDQSGNRVIKWSSPVPLSTTNGVDPNRRETATVG
jgi:hypothetical protein